MLKLDDMWCSNYGSNKHNLFSLKGLNHKENAPKLETKIYY